MDKAVRSLTERLSEANVRAILLKGQAIAALYPDPEVRQCGDIDLFVPDSADIAKIVRIAGTSDVGRHSDGSLSFNWDGFPVEIHPRILDIHSRRSLRRLSAFPVLKTVSGSMLADGSPVTVPSPQATLLMLSAHIFKHAAGRGIGLRQLCDMAVASRRYAPMIPPGEMDAIFRAAGLARWNRMLYSFLSLRLGLEAEYVPLSGDFVPSGKLASRLEKIILDGGNFGQHTSGVASRRGPRRGTESGGDEPVAQMLLRVSVDMRVERPDMARDPPHAPKIALADKQGQRHDGDHYNGQTPVEHGKQREGGAELKKGDYGGRDSRGYKIGHGVGVLFHAFGDIGRMGRAAVGHRQSAGEYAGAQAIGATHRHGESEARGDCRESDLRQNAADEQQYRRQERTGYGARGYVD